MRSENPHPCFGREHGRNKGEFNSLGGRLGLILPVSLMLQRPSEPAFPGRSARCGCKNRCLIRESGYPVGCGVSVPSRCSGTPAGSPEPCHRKARLAGPITGVAIPARAPSGPNWMCPKGRHDCPKDLERDLEKRLVRDRAMRRLHRRRNRWRCPTGPMAVAVELDP